MKIDNLDKRIISTLQVNARITNRALAEQVGLSPSACLQRLRKLEEGGILGPYLAQVRTEKLAGSVSVMATVSLETHDSENFRAFEQMVADIPEITECVKVSGAFDYLLRFDCHSVETYHSLSDSLLQNQAVNLKLSSHFVLSRPKAFSGLPLEKLLNA